MDPDPRSVQSILQRVEEDLQRGDYKLAETRLSAHMNSKGYNAEMMARLGRIAHDMRDPFAAGKYWIVSTAEGPEVEAAINVFLQRCNKDPRQAASQVPRYARLKLLASYPLFVQARLQSQNLSDEIIRKAAQDQAGDTPMPWSARFFMIGCMTSMVIGAVIFGVGLYQLTQWMHCDPATH